MTRLLLACLAMSLLHAGGVQARMYQWTNPGTGSVQLSGTPPTWYRSGAAGPRVRVFDRGKLVDDTSIALPEPHAQELRDAAFRELEERRKLESLRKLEQVAKRESVKQAEAERRIAERQAEAVAKSASPDAGAAPDTDPAGAAVPDQLTPAAIERLKAIVSEFDRASSTRRPE